MEKWEYQYDQMLANPPEEESNFKCSDCGNPFYYDDKVYHIEGECLCEECAKEWLENQWRLANEEQLWE